MKSLDNKFKIVIASGTYLPELGGMATFVKNLSDRLFREKIGVSVIAYAFKSHTYNDPFLVKLVSRSGGAVVRYIRYFFALKKIAKNANLIYAQDLASSGLPAALISLLTGKKLIIRLGGDFLWEQMVQRGRVKCTLREYYSLPKSLIEKFYLAVYRFVLTRSVLIIFNNTYQPKLYQEIFGSLIKKSVIVHNPAPKNNQFAKSNFAGDIMYFGRFIKVKNLQLLISAFANTDTQKNLVMTGAGSEAVKLQNTAKRLGVEQKVKFVNSVSRGQVLEMMKSASLVVIPSLTELNPNVALEAFGAGIPVVLTQENGLPKELKVAIKQFDPNKENELSDILDYLQQKDSYEQYCKALSAVNFNWTWDSVADEHLNIFKEL